MKKKLIYEKECAVYEKNKQCEEKLVFNYKLLTMRLNDNDMVTQAITFQSIHDLLGMDHFVTNQHDNESKKGKYPIVKELSSFLRVRNCMTLQGKKLDLIERCLAYVSTPMVGPSQEEPHLPSFNV